VNDKTKKSSKKGLVIALIILSVLAFICYAIYEATQQVQEELSSTGSLTRGSAPVHTNDIMEQSVDGTVSVPATSPIAQESQEIEDKERNDAVKAGRSYLGKTRVLTQDENGSTKTDDADPADSGNNLPSAQTVNELGEEETQSELKGANNSSKLTGTNRTTGDTVVLPLKGTTSISQEAAQIAHLKKQLAESRAGQKAEDMRQMRENAKRQQDFEKQREMERQNRITEGAKSLFTGLPFAPDSGGKFKISYTEKQSVYSASSETVFSAKDAKAPAASALYRTDGGQTQSRIHPNYLSAASNLGKQLAGNKNSEVTDTNFSDQEEKVLFDAGEIAVARTTLPIDSDVPGPIRFKILNSRAKGSIGFGKMELIEQAPGVGLTLSSIIYDGKVVPAKAWALSPDTEKALFDNDVDHHYLQRFGGLGAGLFMSGFLTSLTDTDVTTSNGETNSSTSAIEGTRDRIVYSIATAAEGFLPILYNYANRPIQVQVPKGQLMYLLFEKQVLATDTLNTPTAELSTEPEVLTIESPTSNYKQNEPQIPIAVIQQGEEESSTTEIWK